MEVEANIIVGKLLKQLRRSIGLTQDELAAIMNKPQSYVSKIESGERSLRVYELFDYSAALGISPHDVIRLLSAELEGSSRKSQVSYAFIKLEP